MASINKKKGSPYWWAWYRNGQGKQSSKSTDIVREPEDQAQEPINRQAAQVVADRFEAQAKAGLPVGIQSAQPASAMLVGIPAFHSFTRGWLVGVGGDHKYRLKLTGYFDHIDQFLGPKAHAQICKLHHPDFVGFAPFLLQMGYSPTSVTLHLKILRQSFLAAQAQGFVLACPIAPKDYLVNPSPNGPKSMNSQQIECLINATAVIDWRTAILFGFYCGMDLMPAVGMSWQKLDLAQKQICWVSFNRAGKPIEMVMPMHPVLENHLIALEKVAISEWVTPSLQGYSDCALRAHFRNIMQLARLPSHSVQSGRGRNYCDIQFGSLKLSFANQMGHTGLFRLSKFLRSMSGEQLAKMVATLPHLNLKPLPLLA